MLNNNPDVPLILIVEDDDNHAELIQRAFAGAADRYRLMFVRTLKEAFAVIEQHAPNLILSDYRLPDGDGSDLMLRANGICPVVLMTSQGNEQVAVEAMKSGAQDYIVKSSESFAHLPETAKYALKTWSLIQSRKLSDEAVRRGKREWEQTFDAVPDLIAIVDLTHTIVRVNHAMAVRCGKTPDELIGCKCHYLVHCSHSPASFCPHTQMLQDGLMHSVEAEINEMGGFFDISVSPLYDSDGHIAASVHVVRDITARKNIENELKSSVLRLNSIFEASNAGIISGTSAWKPDFFNTRILEMFGYTFEELKELSYFQLLHPSSHAEAAVNMLDLEDKRKSSITSERLFVRKDGSTFWGFLSGRSMVDENGNLQGYMASITDITDRKREEEKRYEMERQFQQTQKLESIGVLAGGIAHDFNNILTIILGHCFIAKEDLDAGIVDKTHIQQIEGAANRAADLCRQMLAYAGRNQLVQTHVNLWFLIDELVKMLRSAIKKNISIELDLKRDVPEISGDNSQIQQIVMNLIINAAEAIDDSNGTISVGLRKAAFRAEDGETDFFGQLIKPGDYACIDVTDTGCGMDEEIQKRIFEPFFTTKFTGRGLGMSAILGIIKSHEGALKLSSTPAVGTKFSIYFPLERAIVTADAILPGSEPVIKKNSSTILLVDDEEALRSIGSALLKSMGYSVVTAQNGSEALELFSQPGCAIDLILLDLIMPVMGGREMYHEVRKSAPTLPVVICSGYGDEVLRETIDNDAYAEYVQKPFKPDVLRSIFNKLIG